MRWAARLAVPTCTTDFVRVPDMSRPALLVAVQVREHSPIVRRPADGIRPTAATAQVPEEAGNYLGRSSSWTSGSSVRGRASIKVDDATNIELPRAGRTASVLDSTTDANSGDGHGDADL